MNSDGARRRTRFSYDHTGFTGDTGPVPAPVAWMAAMDAASSWIGQVAAAAPRAALSAAMMAPPTVTARNDRAKPVWKNL